MIHSIHIYNVIMCYAEFTKLDSFYGISTPVDYLTLNPVYIYIYIYIYIHTICTQTKAHLVAYS